MVFVFGCAESFVLLCLCVHLGSAEVKWYRMDAFNYYGNCQFPIIDARALAIYVVVRSKENDLRHTVFGRMFSRVTVPFKWFYLVFICVFECLSVCVCIVLFIRCVSGLFAVLRSWRLRLFILDFLLYTPKTQ